jgi:hypothetical protein
MFRCIGYGFLRDPVKARREVRRQRPEFAGQLD